MAGAIGLDAAGDELGFLDETAFNLHAQRGLPRAANHYVENEGSGKDDGEEGRHQFEENPIGHFFLTPDLSLWICHSGSPALDL
jgi:hypothetical protein